MKAFNTVPSLAYPASSPPTPKATPTGNHVCHSRHQSWTIISHHRCHYSSPASRSTRKKIHFLVPFPAVAVALAVVELVRGPGVANRVASAATAAVARAAAYFESFPGAGGGAWGGDGVDRGEKEDGEDCEAGEGG